LATNSDNQHMKDYPYVANNRKTCWRSSGRTVSRLDVSRLWWMAIPELIIGIPDAVSAIPGSISGPDADLHPSRHQGQLYQGHRGRQYSGRSFRRAHPPWGSNDLFQRWRCRALCESCGVLTAPPPLQAAVARGKATAA